MDPPTESLPAQHRSAQSAAVAESLLAPAHRALSHALPSASPERHMLAGGFDRAAMIARFLNTPPPPLAPVAHSQQQRDPSTSAARSSSTASSILQPTTPTSAPSAVSIPPIPSGPFMRMHTLLKKERIAAASERDIIVALYKDVNQLTQVCDDRLNPNFSWPTTMRFFTPPPIVGVDVTTTGRTQSAV